MILVITVHKALNRHVAVFLWFAPLLFLWQALIRQVSIEWSVNPQYAFGWAVPLLCLSPGPETAPHRIAEHDTISRDQIPSERTNADRNVVSAVLLSDATNPGG